MHHGDVQGADGDVAIEHGADVRAGVSGAGIGGTAGTFTFKKQSSGIEPSSMPRATMRAAAVPVAQ